MASDSVDENHRHVLVTVHGIRTFGGWQLRLERLVHEREPACDVHRFNFNYFNALAFWFPPTRWLVGRRFARELQNLVTEFKPSRLDIVAHSFGTYVVVSGLRHVSPFIQVHTLILSGSVLPENHYWGDLVPKRVSRIINDCGFNDSVLILSQALVPLTGMAGRVGFVGLLGSNFENRYFDFGHSGYFQSPSRKSDNNFMREKWLPLLTTSDSIEKFDFRGEASALTGIQLTFLRWINPVKIAIVWGTMGLLLLYLVGLWASAALTVERLNATIDLLRSPKLEDKAIAPNAVSSLASALALSLGTNRVLWVDDNPENNRFERSALRRWNLCFTNVKSTFEAEKNLRESPGKYALVISDWNRAVAGDNGEATALALQRLGADVRPPLIFYVSPMSATADHRAAAGKLGALIETADPFTLSSTTLDALAAREAAGRMALRLPATLTTGFSWLQRQFLSCATD